MNSYYYEFRVGFNLWYIVLPLLLAFTAFLGARRYYLEAGTMRIKNRGRKLSITAFVAVLVSDLIVTTMMVCESGSGLVQLITNSLGKDDSATWALIIAFVILIIVMPYLLFNLFAQAVKTGEYYQLGRLTEKRREESKLHRKVRFLNQN